MLELARREECAAARKCAVRGLGAFGHECANRTTVALRDSIRSFVE
jgi:hypothetical protein